MAHFLIEVCLFNGEITTKTSKKNLTTFNGVKNSFIKFILKAKNDIQQKLIQKVVINNKCNNKQI